MAGTTSYEPEQPAAGDLASSGYDPSYVPDSVKSFVVHMYRHIREKNVYEIHQMYETSFQSISERLFKDSPWPSVDAVASYVDNDHVFCLLYREMWYRHLYARLSPTPKQRIDSWDNYCSLFQVVLHGVVNMQLPNQWLWDMVDEFVYQFQSFCQYRAKMKNKTEQEIALLRQYDQAWNVYGVLNFLQALVEKSMIIQILEQEKEGLEQFTATDGYDNSGGSNVFKDSILIHYYDDEAFTFSYACQKLTTPSSPICEEPLVNYNQAGSQRDELTQKQVKELWVLLLLFVVISDLFLGFETKILYSAYEVTCDMSWLPISACLSTAVIALPILFAIAVNYNRLLEEINNSTPVNRCDVYDYSFKRMMIILIFVVCLSWFSVTLEISCSKPCNHST